MGCDFISLDVMQVRYSAGRAVVHGPARLPTTVAVPVSGLADLILAGGRCHLQVQSSLDRLSLRIKM
jgi:hypothetical protein